MNLSKDNDFLTCHYPATFSVNPTNRRHSAKSTCLHLMGQGYRDITRCLNRAALVDQDATGQRDSRKAADPPSIGTRRTRQICISPIRCGGNTDERAKLPVSPDCREHGLQGRFSSMGTPSAHRRLIAVSPHDPNLHRKNRGAHSVAQLAPIHGYLR